MQMRFQTASRSLDLFLNSVDKKTHRTELSLRLLSPDVLGQNQKEKNSLEKGQTYPKSHP